MTIESLMTFVGCAVSIFALGYMIGYNHSKKKSKRPLVLPRERSYLINILKG